MANKDLTQHTFRSALLFALTLGLVISFLGFWIFGSYFRVDVPASLIFKADDGWCDKQQEGIGVHCFGDFHERIGLRPGDRPWHNNLETSPIMPFVTWIANFALLLFPSRLVLLFFLSLYVIAGVFPFIRETIGAPLLLRATVLLVAGVCAYPILFLLDRGHALALAVPFIYQFLRASILHNSQQMSIAVIALSCIKPQFLFLSLVFLLTDQLKHFFRTFLFGGMSIVFLLIAAGGMDLARLKEFADVSSSYATSYRELSSINPANASFAATAYIFLRFVQRCLDFLNVEADLASLAENYGLIASVMLVGGVIVSLYFLRHRLSYFYSSICLLVLVSLGLGKFVAPYYLAFVVPVSALVMSFRSEIGSELNLSDIRSRCLFFAISISSSPILIPVIPHDWFSLVENGQLLTVRTLNVPIAVCAWLAFIGSCIFSRPVAHLSEA